MLLKYEIIWMQVGQIIRLWNDINFSETSLYFIWLTLNYSIYFYSCLETLKYILA